MPAVSPLGVRFLDAQPETRAPDESAFAMRQEGDHVYPAGPGGRGFGERTAAATPNLIPDEFREAPTVDVPPLGQPEVQRASATTTTAPKIRFLDAAPAPAEAPTPKLRFLDEPKPDAALKIEAASAEIPALDGEVLPPDDTSQFRKGIDAGVSGAKQMAAAASTIPLHGAARSLGGELEAYDRIERGEPVNQQGMDFLAGRARAYAAASPEQRQQLRDNAARRLAENAEVRQSVVEAWKRYGEEVKASQGRTPNFTDIRDVSSFGDWAAFNIGQGIPYLGASVTAAIIGGALGGAPGAAAGTVAAGYGMGVGDIQSELMEKGIHDRGDVAMAGGVPYAALDMLGPVGRSIRLISKPTLEAVAQGYFRRLGKEVPANAIEEFLNEAGQEIVKDYAVATQTGEPVLTEENLLKWFNSGMAGVASGGPAGAVTASLPQGGAQPKVRFLDEAQQDAPPAGAVPAETVIGAEPQAQPPQPEPEQRPNTKADLKAIIDDERPLDEIKAAHQAAANWTATPEWQDVPAGAVIPQGVEIETAADGKQRARLAPEPGSPEAPVRVETPEDILAGAERTAEPTPAQAEAGNYRKRHVKWQGIDIAIETEAGQERTGIAPDGTPWSVTMPAPYGYIKRTTGKDGDQVDVYLGPQPDARQVFVVDQVDPKTGKFDEHKIMASFPDAGAAVAAYDAAFSDQSGSARMGAITPMAVGAFKTWLAKGDTTKAVRYRPPTKQETAAMRRVQRSQAARQAVATRRAKHGPLDIFQFIAAAGGIASTDANIGDVRAVLGRNQHLVPLFGALIRKDGRSLDEIREAAEEAGYIGQGGTDYQTTDLSALLEAMDRQHRGNPVYSAADASEAQELERRRSDEQERDREADALRAAQEIAREYAPGLDAEQLRDLAALIRQGVDPLDAIADIAERAALAYVGQSDQIEGDADARPDQTPQAAEPREAGRAGAAREDEGSAGPEPDAGRAPEDARRGDEPGQGQRSTGEAPQGLAQSDETPSRGGAIERLGEEFLAAVPSDATPRQANEAAAKYLVDRGRRTGNEALVVWDIAGGRFIEAATANSHNHIPFTNAFLNAAVHGPARLVAHHNHPSNRSLSPADLAALSLPGLRWVIAHGHRGDWYAARLSGFAQAGIRRLGIDNGMKAIESLTRAAEEQVRVVLARAALDEAITVAQAEAGINHLTNRALEAAGLISYLSNRVSGNFAEVYDRAVRMGARAAHNAARRTYGLQLPEINNATVHDRSADSVLLGRGMDIVLGRDEDTSSGPARGEGSDPGGGGSSDQAQEADSQGELTPPASQRERLQRRTEGKATTETPQVEPIDKPGILPGTKQGRLLEERPKVDRTAAGPQPVIPGAERITDKELAERRMAEPKRAAVAQKPADEGLFDVAGRGQGTFPGFREDDPVIVPPTTPQAQAGMLSAITRGQPLDRAMRMPFALFGGLDAKGEWKPGQKLSAKAGRILTEAKFSDQGRFGFINPWLEAARRGLVDRYGLPAAYQDRDRGRALDERRVMLQGAEVMKTLKDANVGPEEAKVLQAILNGERVAAADMEKLAAPIRKAIDDLGQEAVNLGLVSPESYERNRGTYVHRVYLGHEAQQDALGRWVSKFQAGRRRKIIGSELKGRGMTLDVELERLQRTRLAGEGRPIVGDAFRVLDRVAENLDAGDQAKPRILERVYLPAGSEVPAHYAGWRDAGTWTVRQVRGGQALLWRDFTKAEREQMGEILDARYTVAKTFMLMAHDLATGRFYKDVAGNAEWARKDQPAERWVDAAEYQRSNAIGFPVVRDQEIEWVKVPDTDIADTGGKKKWGALAGMYVRAEIWRDLNELDQMNRPSFWTRLMTQWKLNKTARSPVVHMNNVMSNLMFMDMADIRLQDLVAGVRAYARGTTDYQEAADHGALGVDQLSQELRQNTLEPILDELSGQVRGRGQGGLMGRIGAIGRIAGAIWDKAKAADQKMVDLYRMEDDVFRMAAYMRRRSQGDTPKQAADFARAQFLDYDIRAPWVNWARRTVLPFIAYTYRAVPVIAHSIATRPWKLAKYFAVAYALNALAYMLAPGDEDEERRVMRAEEKGYTWLGVPRLLRMPWRDRDGNPVFLDIRRWIPAGDVFDVSQGSSALGIPSWLQFGGPAMLAFEFLLNKKAFDGKPIANTLTDTPWEKTRKTADWLYKSWMPSAPWVPNSWYSTRISEAARGVRDASGKPQSLPQAVASSVGIKVKSHDIDTQRKFRNIEFEKEARELRSQRAVLRRDLERQRLSPEEFKAQNDGISKKFMELARRRRETLGPKTGQPTQ